MKFPQICPFPPGRRCLCVFSGAGAQSPTPTARRSPWNRPKKAMAAAEAEARKNNWNSGRSPSSIPAAIWSCSAPGKPSTGSIKVARESRGRRRFRRPTKVFQDLIAQGGVHLRLQHHRRRRRLRRRCPSSSSTARSSAGGVFGVASNQDAQVAQAGADAVNRRCRLARRVHFAASRSATGNSAGWSGFPPSAPALENHHKPPGLDRPVGLFAGQEGGRVRRAGWCPTTRTAHCWPGPFRCRDEVGY